MGPGVVGWHGLNVVAPDVLHRFAGRRIPLLPVHPCTEARLRGTAPPAGLQVIPRLGYLALIALEASDRPVLTDSGGVKEETTALGVLCLTLRDNTERPTTLTDGTNRLVGSDPARIVAQAVEVIVHPLPPRAPSLWHSRANQRIADVLAAGGTTR